MAVGIVGTGSFTPSRIVTNTEISRWCGAPVGWIEERTGITTRRYVTPGTCTSEIAAAAAGHALAGDDLHDGVDLLVMATSTPDQPLPATAAMVQARLGLPGIPAFDVNAVCSGFLYALVVAARMTGPDRGSALVVAADIYSGLMDTTDRRTVSLFGDGAGAVTLGPVPDGFGVLSSALSSDGSFADLVEVPVGGTRRPHSAENHDDRFFRMRGREVLEYADQHVPKVVAEALAAAQVDHDGVTRVVVHQGNPKMVEQIRRRLGFGDGVDVPIICDSVGNTGSASIPMTLDAAHRRNPIRRGEIVLLVSVGGGMNSGAVVLRWF